MEYIHEPAFINRKKEIDFLYNWISERPKSILFVYGPKSSGKTTLLYKFVNENLNDKKYDVKFYNLREIFITNYRDFLQAFFDIDYSKSKDDVKELRQYDLKVFKLSVESLKGLENKKLDPFVVMKKELDKLNKQGIKPLIIIDELQALANVYMNGQRELLKELFNFFVAITKEAHLCHVIISSSDGYFIERIYADSKLLKTSHFMEVDYLPKGDVLYWLTHLKEESSVDKFSLTPNQIERIWYYFGGSVWEITDFLSQLISIAKDGKVVDAKLNEIAVEYVQAYKIRFEDYVYCDDTKEILLSISDELFRKKGFFVIKDLKSALKEGILNELFVREELANLVQNNLFSYNPVKGEYKPQGNSVALGLQLFCEEISV